MMTLWSPCLTCARPQKGPGCLDSPCSQWWRAFNQSQEADLVEVL